MENLVEPNTWYSGDWRFEGNNTVIPYNGLKIVATANYSEVTTPPTTRKLISVDLDVIDYTNDANGISSPLTLSKTALWYDIPIPEDTSVTPPVPNLGFTVVGILTDTLGNVKLDATPGGTYLNIQFRYGPVDRKREELGYIMEFVDTFQDGEDPIVVEE